MRPWSHGLGLATGLLVCCAPLLVLAVKGWAPAVLFTGALLALVMLARGGLPAVQLPRAERGWAYALIVALLAPIVAVALSATLRGDSYPAPFDAPSRFVLGVPIFLFMLRARVDAARWLRRVLPLALLLALASLELIGRAPHWPQGRDTTSAVDPLVFGYLSLAFGLMCLVSMTPRQWRERQWGDLLWSLVGAVLGFYLSLRSGSRTGWAAIPLVLAVWLHLHWGRRHRWGFALALATACAVPVAIYLLLPTVHLRVDEAWQEIASYPWTGVAPYTSIGLRITYLRVAADSFAVHPWTGMGDTSHTAMNQLPTFAYASPQALEAAFHAAFHNQVVSNAVRYGVGGMLTALALLLVPLALCARQLRREDGVGRQNAAMGFAYTACIVVSSLSTEVVDLKFLASLYATMVALLCGAALAVREPALGPVS